MRRIIIVLTGVFLLSNAIWGFMYFKKAKEPLNTNVQIYSLNGEGENWDVINYKIIVSPTSILRGHGSLVYKGEPQNIENSSYYMFEAQEKNKDNIYQTVYVKEVISNSDSASILDNINDIGSMTSEYSYDELEKDRQNYASSTLTITWNDNEGKLHSETVNLDIDNEIFLK